jgi:MoxR-like ATPase
MSVAAQDFSSFSSSFDRIVASIEKVIKGKNEVVRLALVALIAEGHLLLEDVPGVGKTMLAKALAKSVDCTWSRIQFTPDLLPTDITGVSVFDRGSSGFEFKPGAVFANIVLGDEINRASPKTQSALLECMEERQVTVDTITHLLHEPFMVVATQNPVEHEGTYPLPESQLDRFMMRLSMGYPSRDSELEVLDRHGSRISIQDLSPVADAEDILVMVKQAAEVHVAPSLKRYIVDIAEATRGRQDIYLGVSPRASLFLLRASRAFAASQSRDYVVPEDIKRLVGPVLAHRILIAPDAQMRGVTTESLLGELLEKVSIPVQGA